MSCGRIRRRPLLVAAVVLVLALGGLAAPGEAADGSLVTAALHVLEEHYVDPVDPVSLLDTALAAVRDLVHGDAAVLPDIPPGLADDEAERVFLQEFRAAAGMGRASPTQLAYAATERMLAALHDSHTYFLQPAEYAEEREELSGSSGIAGIGVMLTTREDRDGARWVFVDDVVPHSPAALAGLRRFDRLLQVDDTVLSNASVETVSRLLRGPAGSTVRLVVGRGAAVLSVAVVREPVRWDPVVARLLAPGIAYLRIFEFSGGAGRATQAALARLGSSAPLSAIVVDLRGNPGGLLTEARRVGGLFLPPGTPFARVTARGGEPWVLSTEGPGTYAGTPLVVLVDGDSASAAEALVAALRDGRRVTVIGERTGGALGGAVLVALPEGAMSVTVERIAGPSGERVEGVGIVPDLQVSLLVADMERGEDTQLSAALRVLERPRTAQEGGLRGMAGCCGATEVGSRGGVRAPSAH